MHGTVMDFVKGVHERFLWQTPLAKVVEVGSHDDNGSVRGIFARATRYVGCDTRAGKGVDVVCSALDLAAREPGEADVVVSTEALEHDRDWRATARAMVVLARPGGLIVATCASVRRQPHSAFQNGAPTPGEYYGNVSREDLVDAFVGAGAEVVEVNLVRNDMDLQIVVRRPADLDVVPGGTPTPTPTPIDVVKDEPVTPIVPVENDPPTPVSTEPDPSDSDPA